MQSEMPAAQDLSRENRGDQKNCTAWTTPSPRISVGKCLLARRFAERGVRFVQVTHSDSKVQWDQHGNLKTGHEEKASEVDKPIAGLLTDLKQRGLLQDTLVMWGGEFGRTPVAQGTNGRDHNPDGFTVWLAGRAA